MKYFLFLFIFLTVSIPSFGKSKIYLRYDQVGYLPGDIKSFVVFSKDSLVEKNFEIIDIKTKTTVFQGRLIPQNKTLNDFNFFYTGNFSELKTAGNYIIKVNGISSSEFKITDSVFNPVVDSIMMFFKEQRCGPTNPYLHKTCHLWDIARLEGENYPRQIDVTGGWHDAGDYLKFLSTTALTTYLLIFSYDFDPVKFGFDNNQNNVPDVLEEAKIGLDWLLRCNFKPDSLITQVQDFRDHQAKWRLPENDSLRFDRVGIARITKSEAGIYAAALAIAAKIWNQKFKSFDFADRCFKSALNIYNYRDKYDTETNTDSLLYPDKNYYGKFELASIELFNITNDSTYLINAIKYADSAMADYWWSYGDFNSLAHYRVAKHNPVYKNYILENLNSFQKNMNQNIFNEGADYSWGSTTTFLGISLQVILLNDLNSNKDFDSLDISERLYAGKKPLGLFFYKWNRLEIS